MARANKHNKDEWVPKTDHEFEQISKAFEESGLEMSADDLKKSEYAGFHIGYIKNDKGEIEYTKPLPTVRFGKRGEDATSYTPATPARITPSKRKSIKHDYDSIFVMGDAQIDFRRIVNLETGEEELVPIHDIRAMKLARAICNDIRPDTIACVGDMVDLSALSRFKLDSDHFNRTLAPAFQADHDFFAGFRADHPDARIIETDSNHNTRLKDNVLKNTPAMYNVRQAGAAPDDYPVLTYPHLANFKALDVEWVSGYGAAEFEYSDDLAFIHGTLAVSKGSTAARLSQENPDRHIVQGHAHRAESHHRTDRRGRQFGAHVVGALCRTTGEVPSYHSAVDDRNQVVKHQENWQQGVMHITRDRNSGLVQTQHILFHDGRAFYNGKEYVGDAEPEPRLAR